MRDGITFHSVTLTFHVHATENRDRVIDTITAQLPSDYKISELVLKGHYGNEIRRFTLILFKEAANHFTEHLFKSLSLQDRRIITLELSRIVDEHGTLYVRLNKQLLFEGRIGLSQMDAVRVKITPKYRFKPTDILSVYRMLLKNLANMSVSTMHLRILWKISTRIDVIPID